QALQKTHIPAVEIAKASLIRLDSIEKTLNVSVSVVELSLVDEADDTYQQLKTSLNDLATLVEVQAPEALAAVNTARVTSASYAQTAIELARGFIEGRLDMTEISQNVETKNPALETAVTSLTTLVETQERALAEVLSQTRDTASQRSEERRVGKERGAWGW